MKYQVLFSLKNNEKIFKTVVCCKRDWRLYTSVPTEVEDNAPTFFLLVLSKIYMY